MPWADYSFYPMYVNLLYLVSLYFKNDMAPKFIHLAFGFGTGWLIFSLSKKKVRQKMGTAGYGYFYHHSHRRLALHIRLCRFGDDLFSTAGVLLFIKWRDSGYAQFKWFLMASCCMGMAIGSKYNALLAWFILTLMLMLSYARDTHKQIAALRYGILFFWVALVVALPWYLKNYIQTGNPFYPLFDSFFESLKQPAPEILYRQAIEKTGQAGFFKIREVMYGETFWETLSIPFRMFFQGEDNSYRYFQGVLNPILIVFSPFILLDGKYKRDKFSLHPFRCYSSLWHIF